MIGTKWRGHFAILAANLVWGVNTPISKSLMPGIVTVNSLNYFRILGAALLFWAFSLFTPREKVAPKDLFFLFGASFFGIVMNQILFFRGLSMTSPIHAALVSTMGPIVTMLISAAYLKEPITGLKVVGVIIGLSGVVQLIMGGTQFPSNGTMLGDLLCLCSSTSYAIYVVMFKNVVSRYAPTTVMKWMFLFAAILCGPMFAPEFVATDFTSFTGESWARIALVVLGATFFCYLMVPIAQSRLRPTTMSMYSYLQPVVGVAVTIVLGMELFDWGKAIAASLVFLGVYIVTQSKSRAQVEAELARQEVTVENRK